MRLPTFLGLAITVSTNFSASAQNDPCHDFTLVDATMRQMVQTVARGGASLSVAREGRTLFERAYAPFDGTEVVPIASATKWLSAAVILALVDEGRLDLDASVSTYLPVFTGPSGQMTVRQMFSHTSGLPGQHWAVGANNLTLEQAANVIAGVPLRVPPGTDFFYGGVSMHVAGRVAEVVSGTSWATLFQTRVAGPLGMNSTDYLGIGTAANPRIAGGARSSLRDYARFLEMIVNRGVFRGTRVLSENAIETMLSDQTNGVPVTSAPPSLSTFLGYGIGCWVERLDGFGRPVEWSSPGAFGCNPWVDLERGTEGILLVEDVNQEIDPYADTVREACREELRFRGLDCFGTGLRACLGELRIDATAPIASRPRFEVTCENAPPLAAGLLLTSLAPLSTPLPLLGVDLWIDPTLGFAVPVTASPLGVSSVPSTLRGVDPGAVIHAQFVFSSWPGCPQLPFLAASPGLSITVQ